MAQGYLLGLAVALALGLFTKIGFLPFMAILTIVVMQNLEPISAAIVTLPRDLAFDVL